MKIAKDNTQENIKLPKSPKKKSSYAMFWEKHSSLRNTFNVIMFVAAPALTFILMENYIHSPAKTMKPLAIALNLLFYYLAALMMSFIMGKLRSGLLFETVFSGIFGIINMYVYRFRATPLLPWDFYSFKTAMSVSGNYDYTPGARAVRVIIGFIILILAEWYLCNGSISFDKKWKTALVRIGGAIISFSLIWAFTSSLHDDHTVEQKYHLYDKLFTPDTMQYKDGTYIAFLMELRYLTPGSPTGYSETAAQEKLASYKVADSSSSTPNIIVIMNECFSDPAVDCKFTTNEDYMPFIHSLQKSSDSNSVTGYLNVSVLGGNTANTEFEFLTGNTMAFLSTGSVPYQQYIHSSLPSLVSHLEKYGYDTTAMHPYHAQGWNRNKVYPYFGFNNVFFDTDFAAAGHDQTIRKYISDQADIEMIEDRYEHKDKNTPMFMFNVTMQNHSGFDELYSNFDPEITADGVTDVSANQYLSLVRESDKALQSLTEYFKDKDKTIIVMFGDHQPTDSVVEPLYNVSGRSCSTLTTAEEDSRYEVPFVIWANYDIDEQKDLNISANYLSGLVLKTAGVPLSDYQQYLEEEQKDYPVITGRRIMNAAGKDCELTDVEKELNTYEDLQYYRLFDWNEK